MGRRNPDYFGFSDVLRVVAGLLLLNCLLSYWFTSSTTWNYDGKWIDSRYIKFRFLGSPINLTIEELSAYNGSDSSLPIYLAINGSVYDVSSSRSIYGPKGSYSVFAGKDCSRAFVTGCFHKPDELTHDLRGLKPEDITAELGKWSRFFQNHHKYWNVGSVELPPVTGDEPTACEHIRYPGKRG